VTATIRRAGIAISSFVIAVLCIALIGSVIPQLLGAATNPIVAIVLGGMIYRDIVRREHHASEPATR
jgi:hypothetical protein